MKTYQSKDPNKPKPKPQGEANTNQSGKLSERGDVATGELAHPLPTSIASRIK